MPLRAEAGDHCFEVVFGQEQGVTVEEFGQGWLLLRVEFGHD
jgi:hypothetical protein